MEERIIIALDGLTLERAVELVGKIGERVYAYKCHDLLDRYGIKHVFQTLDRQLCNVDDHFVLFADYKLHDIPHTVKLRAEALADWAGIITVHAKGGVEMMSAAMGNIAHIHAVTELTSQEQADLSVPLEFEVLRLARNAKLAGVDGIVCSAKEVGMLSKRPELKGLEFIVPGIRSSGEKMHDQKRTDSPGAAIRNGATRLVIGRPITEAADPLTALGMIEKEITETLEEMRR